MSSTTKESDSKAKVAVDDTSPKNNSAEPSAHSGNNVLVQELELYTIAVGTARAEGVILYSEKGTPVANPAFSIASTHARVIEGLCKTMGLTFVARAAMDAPESVKAKAGNPFAV